MKYDKDYPNDADYKKMYLTMYNAASDAFKVLLHDDIAAASYIIIKAQLLCEEIYVSGKYPDKKAIEEQNDAAKEYLKYEMLAKKLEKENSQNKEADDKQTEI